MCATAVVAPRGAQLDAKESMAARVAEHMPQVRRIAQAIARRLPHHISSEDLVQAGVLGLMDAIQKFDASKHVQFPAYANFRIHGAIVDSLRELDWAPRELRKQARRIHQSEHRLNARLGRKANEEELAKEMAISVAELRNLRSEIDVLDVASLDAPAGIDQEDLASQVRDARPTPFEDCRRAELRRLLATAIGELPQREHHVLALYYFEELTMKEVGRVLGVDESRVSQIHTAAMARLSTRLRALFSEHDLRS